MLRPAMGDDRPDEEQTEEAEDEEPRAEEEASDDEGSEPSEDDSPEPDEEASDEADEGPPDEGLPGEGTADGDALREAHVAFEAGDYRAVRQRCRALEEKAEDHEVREAAAALRRRVEVDPIQVVVLAACAAVVIAIVYRWIL